MDPGAQLLLDPSHRLSVVDKLATDLVEPFLRFLLVGSKQVDNVLVRHLCMMEDQIVQMKRWFVNVFKTLPLIDLFRSS